MAISYIFGSDAVDTTLLFVADVAYLVSTIGRLGVFLAGVAIVVTVIYRIGLNERYDKSFFRAGFISAA